MVARPYQNSQINLNVLQKFLTFSPLARTSTTWLAFKVNVFLCNDICGN